MGLKASFKVLPAAIRVDTPATSMAEAPTRNTARGPTRTACPIWQIGPSTGLRNADWMDCASPSVANVPLEFRTVSGMITREAI